MQQVQQQNAASVPEGLGVALHHPAFSTNVRILCAAACTCRAWREAVQQCSACNTAVEVRLEPLSLLCSFARWLVKHAALVSSITISPPVKLHSIICNGPGLAGFMVAEHLEAAQQLLQMALQLATALPAAAAAGQNAAAAGQQQQPVRLPNISSITMAGDAAMLRALPAHSLTHLDLEWLPRSVGGPAASAALAQLSNLERLRMRGLVDYVTAPSYLASVAQLSRLTSLDVDDVEFYDFEELSQLVAQPLPLRVLRFRRNDELQRYDDQDVLDMSHLTQLLQFSDSCYIELDAIFPPQLQQLELSKICSTTQFEALMPLHQLRRLEFVVCLTEPGLLLRLTQLPALQQLSLAYGHAEDAAGTAASWPQLPQLCELEIEYYDLDSRQQWEAILNGVAASTNLTRLRFQASLLPAVEQEPGVAEEHVAACAKLACVTNLQALHIYDGCCLVPGDALALTALTGLTRLVLEGAGAGVGDLAATAIAGTCKQLCHLNLSSCALGSMACLATVRHLTQLTDLRLEQNDGLTQQGLMLLTGLKRLKHLGVERSADVTDEVVKSFWAAVRGQQL